MMQHANQQWPSHSDQKCNKRSARRCHRILSDDDGAGDCRQLNKLIVKDAYPLPQGGNFRSISTELLFHWARPPARPSSASSKAIKFVCILKTPDAALSKGKISWWKLLCETFQVHFRTIRDWLLRILLTWNPSYSWDDEARKHTRSVEMFR